LKKTFFPINDPFNDERVSGAVIANRQGDPLSMTFGAIVAVNLGGADCDKTSARGAGAFSVETSATAVSEALGVAIALSGEVAGFAAEDGDGAAGCDGAAVVLSREHAVSSDAAIRMAEMILGLFIYGPFFLFIANREKL
jgi:hypothetical protein